MKPIIKIIIIVILLANSISCSKDALRRDDSLLQLNATESVNDPFLLSSIIKQTAVFYQDMGYENSKLPAAVQYMERNFQGSDNTYSGFASPTNEMYTAMEILKLIDGSIEVSG